MESSKDQRNIDIDIGKLFFVKGSRKRSEEQDGDLCAFVVYTTNKNSCNQKIQIKFYFFVLCYAREGGVEETSIFLGWSKKKSFEHKFDKIFFGFFFPKARLL